MRTLKGGRTLPCDGTVANNLRVKFVGGVLTVCGATDAAIGIVDGVPLNGFAVVISPKTEDGVSIVCIDTPAVGALVYGAANGKVTMTSGGGAVTVGTNWRANMVAGALADVQLA